MPTTANRPHLSSAIGAGSFDINGDRHHDAMAHHLVKNKYQNDMILIRRAEEAASNHASVIKDYADRQDRLDAKIQKEGPQRLKFKPESRYFKEYNGSVTLPAKARGIRLPIQVPAARIATESIKISRDLNGLLSPEKIEDLTFYYIAAMELATDSAKEQAAKKHRFNSSKREKYFQDLIMSFQDGFRPAWNKELFNEKKLVYIDYVDGRRYNDEEGPVERIPRLFFPTKPESFPIWQGWQKEAMKEPEQRWAEAQGSR